MHTYFRRGLFPPPWILDLVIIPLLAKTRLYSALHHSPMTTSVPSPWRNQSPPWQLRPLQWPHLLPGKTLPLVILLLKVRYMMIFVKRGYACTFLCFSMVIHISLPQSSTQYDVSTVCVPMELVNHHPVWCWSSVCPHGTVVNLLQPASTQYDVSTVCVPIELLSTYFNLPQPSVMFIQCVSP